MGFPALFTQAHLEIATGGADKLLQLADKNRTGNINDATVQAFIAEVIRAASGEVYPIVQVAWDPNDPTVTGADALAEAALPIALYWAWHKSTGGVAVPEEVKTARQDAKATLKEMRDGMQALGTTTDPASNAGAKTVDIDSSGKRVLRRNMGGFC